MEDLESKFKDILEVAIPEIEHRTKTFLEIAEMPHYENVDSNILAFFFNKDGEHQLQDLFLRSLVEIIEAKIVVGKKDIEFVDWTVEREVVTRTGTRIDLVIQSRDGDKAIIIENKIYHWLANDLQSYWNQYYEIKEENKVGIVLSINPTSTANENFICITHKELNEGILKNLQRYSLEANDKFLVYLEDYIENKKRFYMSDTKKEQLSFYFQNIKKINELADIKQHTVNYIFSQIEIACNELGFTSYGGVKKGRYFHFAETSKLYFAIFPNEIFSNDPKYRVILESRNLSKEVQQMLINSLKLNDCWDKDITILAEPSPKSYAHLAQKTYPFDPNTIELFCGSLIKNLEKDFVPLKEQLIPLVLTEIGK